MNWKTRKWNDEGFNFNLFNLYVNPDKQTISPKTFFGHFGIQWSVFIEILFVAVLFKEGWIEITLFNYWKIYGYADYNSYLLEDDEDETE